MIIDFTKIGKLKRITVLNVANFIPCSARSQALCSLDAFCDENGITNTDMPRTEWTNSFQKNGDKTMVSIVAQYDSLENLEKVIFMGFQEGFTMAIQNLDELLLSLSK